MLGALSAAAKVVVIPVPQSLQASRFKVTVNGKPAAFLNAAANYYELSLDLKGKAKGFVRIPTDGGYSFTLRSREGGLERLFFMSHQSDAPRVCNACRPGMARYFSVWRDPFTRNRWRAR